MGEKKHDIEKEQTKHPQYADDPPQSLLQQNQTTEPCL